MTSTIYLIGLQKFTKNMEGRNYQNSKIYFWAHWLEENLGRKWKLLIFGYIRRLFETGARNATQDLFTLLKNMIPTAIGKLKELKYSKKEVTEYLNSINKNTMFSYRKILTKYSVSDSVFDNIKMHYLDTISTYDKKFTKFLIEIVNNAYTYYDRFFS